MRKIRTITGDCTPEGLGYCQCHEHLLIAKGKSFKENPALWMEDVEASCNEVKLYRAAGGNAVVDVQPAGAGSMPWELYKVSKATGVKIIASTGFHKLVFYPEGHWIFTEDLQRIAGYFIADIQSGLAVDADSHLPVQRCGAKVVAGGS